MSVISHFFSFLLLPSLSHPTMPTKTPLTPGEKANILLLHDLGHSWASIGRRLGREQSVARIYYRRYREERARRNAGIPAPRRGRPTKITDRFMRRIYRLVLRKPWVTVKEIVHLMCDPSDQLSDRTVRRCLHRLGYRSRVPLRRPLIRPQNRVTRLRFAMSHLHCEAGWWSRVLWSDESYIRMSHFYGRPRVWRTPREVLRGKCLRPTWKGDRQGLMVWGTMSANGVGTIRVIRDTVTSTVYQDLLRRHVILDAIRLCGLRYLFQQDNAPPHTAQGTRRVMSELGLRVMEWPAQSPDLNPIEHLWCLLKMRVYRRGARSLDQLEAYIKEEWAKITPEECARLVRSMPRRIRRVVDNDGGNTLY
jgi:transposase